ncbi:MAG TPA: glycoside hydrolase family 3 N-terminal domain-containing protein [bacterium]|nr:glycoside hydrolase family 3 N-terminal domain-containing protein [bacterium]
MVRSKMVSPVYPVDITPEYKNPQRPIEVRVADLLARMTLEEKVAQMLSLWKQRSRILQPDTTELNLQGLEELCSHGMGQITRPSDLNGGLTPEATVEVTNALQRWFVEHTRLGIPVIFHEECLHGLAAKEATSYPQPIGLASTFNPQIVEEIYSAIAEAARSRGAHQALTPVVDVVREPRWGRVEETYGEDPYLTAQLGTAAVKGFQGDGEFRDKKHMLATLKHFTGHGEPESGSNIGPANISERVLRDIFFYPFRQVIKKARPAAIMPSYNEIDGLPSHANTWLLKKVLREEWGYTGMLVSDYFAITELYENPISVSHGVAVNKLEAALLAAKAGVNIELPDLDCYPHLIELVHAGRLAEAEIDALVRPLLYYKFKLGLFDDPYVDPMQIRNEERLLRERGLALRAAQETMILLKNEGDLLPLDAGRIATMAVIGPNADRKMLGGYSGEPHYYRSVLEGIIEKVGKTTRVLYSEGCKLTVGGSWNQDEIVLPDPEENRQAIAEAATVARQADLVLLVLGGNEQTSREAWAKNHLGDRTSLDLPGQQNELVQAIQATGKPVVVLLFNGRPNSITTISREIPAILECWYLGQETGYAVADVLFGDYNPGGKLPVTIPRSVGHLPCFYNHKPSARRGYVFDDISPLYPFGFGKSYTTFAFSRARLEKSIIAVGESTTLHVDVTNTGQRAGTEVVQMYIRDLFSSVTRPVKELRGFCKIELAPGETRSVALAITPDDLAFTAVDMVHKVEPGEFEIMVGNSSQDADLIRLQLTVN